MLENKVALWDVIASCEIVGSADSTIKNVCANDFAPILKGSKIKKIFGAGARKFSAKEKKCVETWISTYNFGLDIIERAYDITISATSKPSIPYAHAILERWFNEGIKSVEQIDALIAQREIDKAGEGSSFNIDEFFNAALDRSYADKK